MRVLDVGSGGGDVAFLAAQIVGPEGEVIGTDRSSSALAWARQRASDLRFSNVRFLQGDPVEMSFNKPFDAVIGRSVLMYYPSPVEALRKLARHLRADGVIAFQEIDCGGARAVPPLASYEKHNEWASKTLRLAGTHLNVGSKLYQAFLTAGLPAPSMQVDTPIIGAYDARAEEACQVLADVLRSLLPLMEKFGVATAAEVDIDTFGQRLLNELQRGGGVMIWNSVIGAWARKPA
jgi:ubiquinone/menaquinone biosynthesis C-methylase UbiE